MMDNFFARRDEETEIVTILLPKYRYLEPFKHGSSSNPIPMPLMSFNEP